MRIIVCEQGSPEWHQARAGVITASMFKVARQKVGLLTEQQQKYVDAIKRGEPDAVAQELAGYKTKVKPTETMQRAMMGLPIGDFSDVAKNYAFCVAVESIRGMPLDEGFETWAMRRGHELEPAARAEHEAQTGLIVQRAGFVTTDDGVFGASADGLIGHDGGSEYKCLVSPETLRKVILDGDISDYIDQIQGCLWLTGRKWWHFGMYCPALEPMGKQLYLRKVERDEDYIEALERDLIEFKGLVDLYRGRLMNTEAAPQELLAA